MDEDDINADQDPLIEAHFAPGGADYAIKLFLSCVTAGQADVAEMFFAPTVTEGRLLEGYRLPESDAPGWAPLTRSLLVSEGIEGVRYVYFEGAAVPIVVDTTYLHLIDFVVSHTPGGWQILDIQESTPEGCQMGPVLHFRSQ